MNVWSRRFRDIYDQIIADIGGPAGLSEGQRQLARRATTLSIACEQLDCRAAAGKKIDLHRYGQLSDRLGRAFDRLGLKRQTRDITPDLKTYLQLKSEAEEVPDG
jgi:hypothetical protein